MRILMLGNSYTSANNMPSLLARLTGAEVVAHTRGGARLAEQLNPKTKLGEKTLKALQNEKWDYVVLQEMSSGPVASKEKFLASVNRLCEQIRNNGAVPVLYATWAYEKDGKQLKKSGMDYEQMNEQMASAYHEAAEQNSCLLADVGKAFYERSETESLYAEDGSHPNGSGSKLAAETIAAAILNNEKRKQS